MKMKLADRTGKIFPILIAALFAVLVFAALSSAEAESNDQAFGAPGYYDAGDIAVINNIILNNGLNWTEADPADGSYVPSDWTGVTWDNDGSVERITELRISSKGLTGELVLTGLDALEVLDCSWNDLTSLDLSGLNIYSLICSNNQLTSLDLTVLASSSFFILNYSFNQITDLDFTGLSIQYLNCSRNGLDSLDLSGLYSGGFLSLLTLYCCDNELTELNVPATVINLDCSGNLLTVLDVSGCANLTYLDCGSNELISLNVSGCPLQSLDCRNNDLTDLDLTNGSATGTPPGSTLTDLDCSKNKMSDSSKVTGIPSSAWNSDRFIFFPQIITLREVGLAAPVGGATVVTSISTAQFTASVTWTPGVSGGLYGYSTTYNAYVVITSDPEKYIMTGLEEGFFTVDGASSITYFSVNSFRVYFPTTKPFPTVAVGDQDVPMEAAQASGSEVNYGVTTSNIANGTYSAILNNAPDGVTVKGGTVTIFNNSGTLTLVGDSSTLPGTYTMTLKISIATSAAFTLFIDGDPIYDPNDVAVINGLIRNNDLRLTEAADDGYSLPGNWKDVVTWSSGSGLGRRIVELKLNSEGLKGSADLTSLSELRNLECMYNTDLVSLNVSGLLKLVYLDCSVNGLIVLDASGCAALTDMDCRSNEIISLNVAGCVSLDYLNCFNNYIAELDITSLAMLTYLDCARNEITELDATNCTLLQRLECERNMIATLEVTNLADLYRLVCFENEIATLDLTGCVSLEYLDCANNKLTSLYVSNIAALDTLDCSDNGLLSLNVTGCTSLSKLKCNYNYMTAGGLPDHTKVTGFAGTWDETNYIFIPQRDFLSFTYSTAFAPPVIRLGASVEIDVSSGAAGGTLPYKFTAAGLPTGLTITEDGVITGTPTALGHPGGQATVTVTDYLGASESINIQFGETFGYLLTFPYSAAFNIPYTMMGHPMTPIVITGVYGGTPFATGAPYRFSAVGLPDGITISQDGTISGYPLNWGPGGTAKIIVTDSVGDSREITITYAWRSSAPLVFVNNGFDIPATTVGTAISNINVYEGASYGMTPYTFSLAPGSALPAGLTLSASGVISGTPKAACPAGTATIVLEDGYGVTAQITINYGKMSGSATGGEEPSGGDSMMLIAVVAVAVIGIGAAVAYFLFLRPKP